MRGGGVRTAQAGLEAAAVPTEACETKAARQAASTSQPGSPRSLLSLSAPFPGSLKPRVYPRSWGSESPLPTTHSSPAGSLFVWLPGRCGQMCFGGQDGLGQAVRGRKERLVSASATADCQAHPRVAASEKSGCLRRRG